MNSRRWQLHCTVKLWLPPQEKKKGRNFKLGNEIYVPNAVCKFSTRWKDQTYSLENHITVYHLNCVEKEELPAWFRCINQGKAPSSVSFLYGRNWNPSALALMNRNLFIYREDARSNQVVARAQAYQTILLLLFPPNNPFRFLLQTEVMGRFQPLFFSFLHNSPNHPRRLVNFFFLLFWVRAPPIWVYFSRVF